MTSTRARERRALVAVAAALLGLAVVSGCSGGSGAVSGGADDNPGAAQASAPAAGSAASVASVASVAKRGAAQQARGAAEVAAGERREVTTAELTVRARDVAAVVAAVRRAAVAAKGFVSDERTSSEGGRTQSELTVRVPTPALDRVMDQAAAAGTALQRSRSSEDVSGTYVDAASRVRSQTVSVERLRTLLARATTIGQVVQVESELARREADLDALKARLQALDDQTTLATLTVSVVPPPVPSPARAAGFGGGLRAGWHALGSAAAVVLVVVGAVLPFGVLAAAVAWPAALVLRRRRRPAPRPAA